jgi:hypothetical protein
MQPRCNSSAGVTAGYGAAAHSDEHYVPAPVNEQRETKFSLRYLLSFGSLTLARLP